jgi:hypothetical protein
VPEAGLGLGLPHRDPTGGEVDLTPAQRAQLADPQATEDERRDDRAPRDVPAICPGVPIELGGRDEQRDDMVRAIDGGLPALIAARRDSPSGRVPPLPPRATAVTDGDDDRSFLPQAARKPVGDLLDKHPFPSRSLYEASVR